ncbi:MAG: hypothetical protein ACYTHK_18155 [Planctomycetota bacterium]|jgi:hypothetical protein
MNRNDERGVALLVVIFFALVAMAYISSALTSSVAARQQARYFTASQRAHEVAESAVHRLVALLATPDRYEVLETGRYTGYVSSEGETSNQFEVSIWPARDDGADNDQDGRTDEEDEADLYEVESTGEFDRVRRTVRVTLLARYRPADMHSATYIADQNSQIGFSGNTFRIAGENHNLAAQQVDGTVVGIGVPGFAGFIRDQVTKLHADNVTGTGGSPSVVEVPELDLQDLVEEGARSANVVLEPETTNTPEKDESWGTARAPAIVYSPGDAHISGGARGMGIMIVNGDLTITGKFAWQGLVIVRGEVRFAGGGGEKRVLGALVVEERIVTEEEGKVLDLRGNIEILFSREAIDRVMQSFATYTILNWREGPNPERMEAP